MDELNWVEVSFLLPGEQAEAVAEILNRYAQQGVVIEDNELLKKDHLLKVYAYLLMDDSLEEKKEKIEQAIYYLNQILPIPKPTYSIIKHQDWMQSWKKQYMPMEIGKKLLVVPAWSKVDNKEQRYIVKINPGMAFGTGTHPTTKLSLELMEKYLLPGSSMMDIGCGSGILSIAAIKLGASKAWGVDISSESVQSSLENIDQNNLGNFIEIMQGSVREILEGIFSEKNADIIVANILLRVILDILDDGLSQLLLPESTLIISGILEEQIPQLEIKCSQVGLKIIDRLSQQDWVALALKLDNEKIS